MLPVYSGEVPGAADQCTPLLAGYHRAIVDVIVIVIFWHGHHRAIVDVSVIFIFISIIASSSASLSSSSLSVTIVIVKTEI